MIFKSVFHCSVRRALLSVFCATSAASYCGAANLDGELNGMLSSMGVLGNYTAPGAFRSQAANGFVGGSLQLRVPNKSYQLAAVRLPQFKGSCNGIDIQGGSFSFISGAQLKDMLAKVTAALPGLAFQMAVDAISPLFGSEIKWLKEMENTLTLQNKSSCELATALVRGVADASDYSTKTACVSLAMRLRGSDAAEAEETCRDSRSAVLDEAKASADPEIRESVPVTGNIVWQALSQAGAGLDAATKEVLMNVTGTLVYGIDGKDVAPYEAKLNDINRLLYGDDTPAGVGGAGPTGIMTVKMWKCDEPTDCNNPVESDEPFVPLVNRVRVMMEQISNKIKNREAYTNPSAEVGFVNATTIPVYRMMAVGVIGTDDGNAQSLIDIYGAAIAADFAYTMINRAAELVNNVLMKNTKLSEAQVRATRDLVVRSQHMVRLAAQERANIRAKGDMAGQLVERLEQMSREMRARSSLQVAQLLGRSPAGRN